MDTAKSFEDLIVWQKAHQLVLDIYSATYSFPREEIYGLTSQLRRAAFSEASLEETRYCLILAKDLKYINNTAALHFQLEEVSKLLYSYINKIEQNK